MVCLACSSLGYPLCAACLGQIRPAPRRVVDGVKVYAANAHTGSAVRLVHNLKYRRSMAAGQVLASHMAERMPQGIDMLVPLPRVFLRRIGHGIDQTTVLAESISRLTGIPVVHALKAPLWNRRLAGSPRRHRGAPTFRVVSGIGPFNIVQDPGWFGTVGLVDDVCTTGSTIVSAANAFRGIGVVRVVALVANSAFEGASAGVT